MGDSYLIADMRARIVHDPWFIETIKDTASQFKAMPYSDPRYGFVDLTEEEILAALEKIRTLKLAATELGSRVRQRLEALRETPS
jgi:pyruvate/2-oxoglutarate dehydrogenase complex dihydrolipoamide dehydrogenase (E3) component